MNNVELDRSVLVQVQHAGPGLVRNIPHRYREREREREKELHMWLAAAMMIA